MRYIDGFVVPVPADKKDAYRELAEACAPLFKEYGALRQVEAWEDDVPIGQLTDFRRAVDAQPGEVIVFSWVEYPSRAVRDEAGRKIMSDPRMEGFAESMPFDGKRMIYGGFEVVSDEGEGELGYVDGSLLAAPSADREACEAHLAAFTEVIGEHGGGRMVRAWSDDVPEGKVTDFRRAVAAASGEDVVFMWIGWPSKAARDAGWGKVMSDPRMAPPAGGLPYDPRRQVHGGFKPILDADFG